MTARRSFIKKSLGLAGMLSVPAMSAKLLAEDLADALKQLNKLTPLEATIEEDLWKRIASAYPTSKDYINLNNAGLSPQPIIVQEAMKNYYTASNIIPSLYLWRNDHKALKDELRNRIARCAGTEGETIAINRNATEGLTTACLGMDLNKGDEVVLCLQDYSNVLQAWKQREMREGIHLKWVNLQFPTEDEDTIVNAFIEASTANTRIWNITHMINWTGQILPVQKLCAEARKRGIISIVDGAQSFAHLDFKISDIQPDYFATCFHKWLSGPFGTGMLHVKKENIAATWPLFSNPTPKSDEIQKFESFGSKSIALQHAIMNAIDFQEAIGMKRKEERLRFLKNYWCEKLRNHPRIKLHVSLKPEYSCGIGLFSIDGIDMIDLNLKLANEYFCHLIHVSHENMYGLRVSPHIYTSTEELDRFVETIYKVAK